ncbi:hypothetical protein [Leptodesmis sp.]|uniref:hypothetical protein n=1 Tax=Leptodesmis sp. TaxID=3100501 RepID=UPI004053554C
MSKVRSPLSGQIFTYTQTRMTMLWNTDVTIQGKTFRLPDDIRELWIESDADKLCLEAEKS